MEEHFVNHSEMDVAYSTTQKALLTPNSTPATLRRENISYYGLFGDADIVSDLPSDGYANPESSNDHHPNIVNQISKFLSGEIYLPQEMTDRDHLFETNPQNLTGCSFTSHPGINYNNNRHTGTAEFPSSSTMHHPTTAPTTATNNQRKETKKGLKSADYLLSKSLQQCFEVLWQHIISAILYIDSRISYDALTEKIRRIGYFASQSLATYGFFTLNQFMGPTRASTLLEWARTNWIVNRGLFEAGQLCVENLDASDPPRSDQVAWIDTNGSNSSISNRKLRTQSPEVQLLLFYIDCVVRATEPSLTGRNGHLPDIFARSSPLLTVYTKTARGSGYVEHYDNPVNVSDGRLLTVLFYLNQGWTKHNGGRLVLWPITKSTKGERQNELSIVPSLDRVVMFYSDERTLHRVEPISPYSPCDERMTLMVWYFDRTERLNYLSNSFRNQLPIA